MPEIVRVVARSGIVESGGIKTLITKDALESITVKTEEGRVVPIGIAHDPFSFPIGKVTDVWIEEDGDEFVAVAKIYIGDKLRVASHAESKTELMCLDFEGARDPFLKAQYGQTTDNRDAVSVDLSNFDDSSAYSEFANDVDKIDHDIHCDNQITRHSIDPEPLMQYVVSSPEIRTALTFFALKSANYVRQRIDEKVKEQTEKVLNAVGAKIMRVLRAHGRRQSKENQSFVTQIVIPGDPEIVLLVRVDRDADIPAIDLSNVADEMNKYHDLIGHSDSATFALSDKNTWVFQYLRTRDGGVIGTAECYEQTMRNLRALRQSENPGTENPNH